MKRLLILILLCFSLVLSADARMSLMQLTAGPSCNNSQQIEDTASAGSQDIGSTSANYFGTKFVYSGTTGKAICKMSIWFEKVGLPTDDYYVAIWGHNVGDYPEDGDVLGTSDALDASTVPAGESEQKVSIAFTTPTAPLANGTTYWVVVYSTTYDASHFLVWHWNTDGTTERCDYDDDGSGTWTNSSTLVTQKYRLYSR